jgi:single-stranded-DNA-specific exonuclease
VNVLQLLEEGRGSLLALGGHAQAAGFSLADAMVEDFRRILVASPLNLPVPATTQEPVDVIIDQQLLNFETLHLFDAFSPFGEGNPRPSFLVKGLTLTNWRIVGKSGEHVKFTWEVNGEELGGIGFGVASLVADMAQGETVDVIGSLETNEWKGRRSLQLAVRDIALSGTVKIVPP